MSIHFPATWRGRIAYVLPFVTVAVTVILMTMTWPQFWLYINFDDTPMNAYQSLLLLIAAAVASVNAWHGALSRNRREWIGWILISLAFAYLSVDEQFMIHETVRNHFLSSYGKLPFLPWVAAGDYLPLLYAIIGLSVMRLVWPFVARHRPTRCCFAAAIALAVTAVVLDSIDWRELPGNWLGREQFIEECMEAMSYSMFVASFLLSRVSRQ